MGILDGGMGNLEFRSSNCEFKRLIADLGFGISDFELRI
jgi:hypothetical protein